MSDEQQDDNVAAEVDDDDLNILLDELIIDDHDFNPWSDFRESDAVIRSRGREGDDSLQSLFARLRSEKSSITDNTCIDTASVSLAVVASSGVQEQSSEESTAEEQDQDVEVVDKLENNLVAETDAPPSSDSSNIVFSSLTPGEQRDNRSWNTRLSRDKVFSRYYHPEQWELSEMNAIQKFLGVESIDLPCSSSEIGDETTNRTIHDIFSPGDNDPKSVLLKRGPILFNGGEEREMLLFTHGFLLSRAELDTNLRRRLHANSEKLKDRFIAVDTDSNNNDGAIDIAEFKSDMNDVPPKKEGRWNWGPLGDKLKQTLGGGKTESNVECAFSFSNITQVESINVCCSEVTSVYQNSSWADLVFAIFIDKRDEPLIIVCSKPEHRSAWVDAFRTCCVNSILLRAGNGLSDAKIIRAQPGWQHRLIRASLFSLVCANDVTGLGEQLDNPSPDTSIDDQDEYRGYSALHYAAILGCLDCAETLLRYRASVNLEDNDLKTPLDHAVLSENSDMINLLERSGGKTKVSMVLFKSAVEEQERMKSEPMSRTLGQKLMNKVQETGSAMVHGMSALREKGDRLERMGNETANLHTDATDFAQLAKQMKEKSKTKSRFFGLA